MMHESVKDIRARDMIAQAAETLQNIALSAEEAASIARRSAGEDTREISTDVLRAAMNVVKVELDAAMSARLLFKAYGTHILPSPKELISEEEKAEVEREMALYEASEDMLSVVERVLALAENLAVKHPDQQDELVFLLADARRIIDQVEGP